MKLTDFFKNLNININIVDVAGSPATLTTFFNVADSDIKRTLAASKAIAIKYGAAAKLSSGAPTATFKLILLKEEREFIALTCLDSLNIKLGLNTTNDPVYWNYIQDNNLLIGGATGQGKTVSIKSIIYQLIKLNADIKLIDLKGYDFRNWKNVPNFEIVSTAHEAYQMLELVKYEIKIRQASGQEQFQPLFVIIDEYAELVTNLKSPFIPTIKSIAQLGRAFNIHMIVATQRPDSTILNGSIKVNFTAKLGFRTGNRFDSATIINMSGLEKLRGKGHAILVDSEHPQGEQLQGYYLSNAQIQEVAGLNRPAAPATQPAAPPHKTFFNAFLQPFKQLKKLITGK